jgi:hypothetical protein
VSNFNFKITENSFVQARDVMRANGSTWQLPGLAVLFSLLMLLVPQPTIHQLSNIMLMNLMLAGVYVIGSVSWLIRTPECAQAEIKHWSN